VQKILDGRNRKGDRDRTHFHFLRGLLYCAECKEAGRDSRLVYSQNTGHGGTYEYYLCTAKQRGLCSMPSVRLDDVEEAVARAVAAEEFHTEELIEIRDQVRHALEEMQSHEQEEKDALRTQLAKLEAQEDRLIDLAADGKLPSSKLRERLEAVTLQKGAVAEKLARTGARIQRGVDRVYASVDLLEKPRELYESLPDSARRNLLGAFFTKLNVLITEDGLHLTSERTEINEAFHEWQTHHRLTSAAHTPTKTKRASRIPAEDPASVPYRLTQSKGLNKPVLVGCWHYHSWRRTRRVAVPAFPVGGSTFSCRWLRGAQRSDDTRWQRVRISMGSRRISGDQPPGCRAFNDSTPRAGRLTRTRV